MRNVLSSRVLLATIIIIVVGVMLLGQMGIAGSQAPAEASASDSNLAASPAPQLDWALAGLLLGGALITLFRPRRRKVVKVTAK
ncbi:MAG: hypothetical protein QGG42_01080 [Phycisphaerae bacterium]|jgi:cell division protein FtsW (lipid II flippase)|nr:hypothetical protein [Phycisphaerae bacterium]